MNKTDKYASIRAWCRMMGSYQYYVEAQISEATTDGAPEGATYKNDDGSWNTLADITSVITRHYFEINHPDLYEKFMNKAA